MFIMKNSTALFICFAMALNLAACENTASSTIESSTSESSGSSISSEAISIPESASSTATSEESVSEQDPEEEAGNRMVVYFSATGNTEQAAA